MMEAINKAINAVKDGYLWLVNSVDDNPQTAIWIAFFFALLLGWSAMSIGKALG